MPRRETAVYTLIKLNFLEINSRTYVHVRVTETLPAASATVGKTTVKAVVCVKGPGRYTVSADRYTPYKTGRASDPSANRTKNRKGTIKTVTIANANTHSCVSATVTVTTNVAT